VLLNFSDSACRIPHKGRLLLSTETARPLAEIDELQPAEGIVLQLA
jgi:hypothetical protein